jgi:uncharacterized protein involved in exopolysaccharide biosynthesis/protein involved in polysaccharide export with SLBB domain
LPDGAPVEQVSPGELESLAAAEVRRDHASVSLRELAQVLKRRRRLVALIEGGLLFLCLLYCLLAPNQYEAAAKIELRTSPASSLSLDAAEPLVSASILSAPTALETLAGVLRSDRLAWRVITGLKLYQAPGFRGSFARRFPAFRPGAPDPVAQAWLLDRFSRRLDVETMPRTLLVQVRFRSRDPALSAAVVNALIRAYIEQEAESQVQSTAQASGWLNSQLHDLKARLDHDDQRLADFEKAHGMVSTPQTLANGQPGDAEHNATGLEMDELSRQLVSADADRILSEAEYRAASQGDPEAVIASDPRLQAQGGAFASALLEQIRARRSDLEQEQAQLSAEHGPDFPRVVEIGHQLRDLDRQRQAEDAKLLAQFKSNWQTAREREQMVRKSLEETTGEGVKLNGASTQYTAMREESDAAHALYLRLLEKVEEAGLTAGVHTADISVVDDARVPVKPVAPNPPLYFAITFFAGLWLAVGGALLAESIERREMRIALVLVAALAAGMLARAQAPTPSTSGLPAGVASLPQTQETKSLPNPKEAPAVWDAPGGSTSAVSSPAGLPLPGAPTGSPMPALIGPGDFLDIGESHTPEFHSEVRVSPQGAVTLPLIGEIKIAGLDEPAAAHAIEAQLLAKGMLLHPLVSVLVMVYAGQDVSVLGEVARPGVYPYTYHHRLLDLISAASGLSPNAGRLVNVFHVNDPKTAHPVVLDPSGTDATGDHNPELSPGDTVQVSRAGLVYVVGDVVRPGGFPVDPVQGLTVVQALSLAWGPSQNAALGKAILIREQKGGRTLTALNLRRMLHGQDPDQPIHDRDILYLPDSMTKNLMNRTLESAIQSTIGVSIYSGLVYSQRY